MFSVGAAAEILDAPCPPEPIAAKFTFSLGDLYPAALDRKSTRLNSSHRCISSFPTRRSSDLCFRWVPPPRYWMRPARRSRSPQNSPSRWGIYIPPLSVMVCFQTPWPEQRRLRGCHRRSDVSLLPLQSP